MATILMLKNKHGGALGLLAAGATVAVPDMLALDMVEEGAAQWVGTPPPYWPDASAAPVSGAGISQASTEFPAERVALAATGCVCASPCQIERIRCTSGAAVNLVVYDNAAASAGTQLYSGTLSAGQEAAITTPIRAINGLRAVFASGAFDFYISQEA